MWKIDKLAQGDLVVHTSVEPTQILAMRMYVDEVIRALHTLWYLVSHA